MWLFFSQVLENCTQSSIITRANSHSSPWRGAGVVELACLENKCAGNRTVGSNPTLSAIALISPRAEQSNDVKDLNPYREAMSSV
jgi:hypothetical protein